MCIRGGILRYTLYTYQPNISLQGLKVFKEDRGARGNNKST